MTVATALGPLVSRPAGDALARSDLRGQVARLEGELSGLCCSAWPRHGFDWTLPGGGSARLLSLGELEHLRDVLATRLAGARAELALRLETEEGSRRLIEEMHLDPGAHRFVRVSNADIGEPGCRYYHSRPRAGLLGMLAGWWRVVVSSGCPLPRAGRQAPALPARVR